ncbi:MAG: hypothetical protein JSR44_02875 [Spirochaetes bacterium]|nr:hypothetical protein [Spirochaetota bacterium]
MTIIAMRRLLATAFLVLFALATSEAVPMATHAFVEVKCPKCKMKIEKKGACPCCHKKKPGNHAVIYDPCADEDGDYTIHFDRVNAVTTTLAAVHPHFISAIVHTSEPMFLALMPETHSPPPRR